MSAKIYKFIISYGATKRPRTIVLFSTTMRGTLIQAILLHGIKEKTIKKIIRK